MKNLFMILGNNVVSRNLACVLFICLLMGCSSTSSDNTDYTDSNFIGGVPLKNNTSIIPQSYVELQRIKEKKYEIILGISDQKSEITGGFFNIWVDLQTFWKLRNLDIKVPLSIEVYDSEGNSIVNYTDVIILKEIDSYEGFHYRYVRENATSDRSIKIVALGRPVKYFLKVKLKMFDKEYSFKPYELHLYGRGIAL